MSSLQVSNSSSTEPLLLDAVVEPISESTCSCPPMTGTACCKVQLDAARRERDNALALARQYRDLAEATRTEY